jgi:putative membrane protein insertion efficiency factor
MVICLTHSKTIESLPASYLPSQMYTYLSFNKRTCDNFVQRILYLFSFPLPARERTKVRVNLSFTASFIFLLFLLLAFFNPLHSSEDELWDFSKPKPEKPEENEFLAGKTFVLGQIKLYQLLLSEQQADVCNFTPSCSHYAYRALKKEGILKGSLMAIDRLQRCNPWAWNYMYEYYELKWVEGRGYKLHDPP